MEKQGNDRRNFIKVGVGACAVLGLSGTLSGLGAKGVDSAKSSESSVNQEFITLNNDVQMPLIGLGTYALTGSLGVGIVKEAARLGYRLFDTAQMYNNEREVAQGLRESGVAREKLFIMTKISNDMGYDETKRHIDRTLAEMKLEYLDLLLLHRNFSSTSAMYRAMEDFYTQGKLKALGISNFREKAYLDFIKTCKIVPAVNQMETHIFLQHSAYQKLMRENGGCALQSWSPFDSGRKGFFTNETLMKIAKKHNKSVAQVALRWLTQRDVVVIPKTSKIERLKENLNIFDFTLDSDDFAQIAKLDTGKSSVGWW
ncbi:aldo/keto reductase [Helicobacter himalayensis]|uniref:aldo/keto reductase n=1 Tax=Helicobacter himalayensis TaxID=1591088 RepID=UPI00082F7D27|nr:aldo/keto reductase [Helicobacter himalayensis]